MIENFQGKLLHFIKYRIIKRLAESQGFSIYEPSFEYQKLLDEHTDFSIDNRPISDKRSTTIGSDGLDLTITIEALEDIIDSEIFKNKRVMETGPKYGIHSRWIDKKLQPSELVFSDFASEKWRHQSWDKEISSPHKYVYGDLRHCDELLSISPLDLIFFLGVMYHSPYHIQLLSMLNRITKTGGSMLLETTFDPRPDPILRVNWHMKTKKAKMVPSLDALRIMLAWTGWRKVKLYKNYRPGSSEILMMCEKTDNIIGVNNEFCQVVTATRLGPDGKPLAIEEKQ